MKDELCSQPVVFNNTRSSFGNMEGLSILDELKALKFQNGMLEPLQNQKRLIRVPILQGMAEWPTVSTLRQARNVLAHGGQVFADVSTIESETDPAVKAKLEMGFAHLYHVPFTHQNTFCRYRATVDLMNLHANLSTLDDFRNREYDLNHCKELLDCWMVWSENGDGFDTYPFTSSKARAYNHLMARYGQSLPRNDFFFGGF